MSIEHAHPSFPVATVSVIIPTLNAAFLIEDLLSSLKNQDYPIKDIFVVDSSSGDDIAIICQKYNQVHFVSISKSEFDHGRTRDMVLRQSDSDIVVFMTQDALPADNSFLGKLVAPLSEPGIAVSFGRQLPRHDASKREALVRAFNYPSESWIRSEEDVPRLGIKAFFCSDVCAAYRRDIYLQLGGFIYPVKTNEDMLFAAKALRSGYRIAYTSDAMVFHSHNLTPIDQYRRNYIQGYEIEKHKTLLGNASLQTEGIKLVKTVSQALVKEGAIGSAVFFGLDCCARWLGNRNGRNAYRKELKALGRNK